jgi:hypothetical protein
VKSLERLPLSNKPKVIITEKLKNQIDWLHEKCGSVEWSGELITSETNTINDLDNWTITCEDIYLVDIGSSAYTEYEVDKGGFKSADIVELYDAYPGLLDGSKKAQHIHTHHNMQAFFSGTDWSQLEDRGVLSNYLLMLIVNFKGEYVAKVAFKAERSGNDAVKLNFANNLDGRAPLTLAGQSAKEVLVVMDCEIIFEKPEKTVDTAFSSRYDSVKKAIAEEAASRVKYTPYKYGGYNKTNKNDSSWSQIELYGDGWGVDDGIPTTRKDKSVMEMTDIEWKDYNKSTISKKDASFALSSYLTNTYDLSNYEPPIDLLIDLNKQLKKKDDLEEYILEFSNDGFRAHCEGIHLRLSTEDFICILQHVKELLEKAKYNRLIKELINEIELMIHEEGMTLIENSSDIVWDNIK